MRELEGDSMLIGQLRKLSKEDILERLIFERRQNSLETNMLRDQIKHYEEVMDSMFGELDDE